MLYQKNVIQRFILGSKPLNKLSSIKQTIRLYTNYLNNTVIYSVSYAYIIVVNEQRSSAITETFKLRKKTQKSFERITKNAISDTFKLGICDFLPMMSENTDQNYAFIGINNTNDGYLYQVKSKSDNDIVYTIVVKIVDDDHINTDTSIDIECECLGYKHRERCWHIDKIRGVIEHNSYCIMCLTPFLDIVLKNADYTDNTIESVNAYDQDGKKILINKAGSMMIHNDCVIYLGEFESLGEDISNKIQEIYKSFYNKDIENSKDLYVDNKKSVSEKNE